MDAQHIITSSMASLLQCVSWTPDHHDHLQVDHWLAGMHARSWQRRLACPNPVPSSVNTCRTQTNTCTEIMSKVSLSLTEYREIPVRDEMLWFVVLFTDHESVGCWQRRRQVPRGRSNSKEERTMARLHACTGGGGPDMEVQMVSLSHYCRLDACRRGFSIATLRKSHV